VLAACGGSGGGGGGTPTLPDVTPPQVISVSPNDGASDVDIPNVTRVEVFFDESIDSSSVGASSFMVTDGVGPPVSGSISMGPATRSAVLTFAQPLARSTQYHVVATTGIRDLAGNALPADFNSSFTTI